jgi:Cu-processing system ATP-binding protein
VDPVRTEGLVVGDAHAGRVVEARGVTKRFGKLEVLRGVDLEVPAGRITGLVGPNASGKSTFIKTVLGLVRPDSGHLTVLGQPVNGDERYRNGLGYMPQDARFPENLTGREVLEMVRDLRDPAQTQDVELLGLFGLDTELGKPVRALSGGTRQKLSAAIAFLFCPTLLVLDEPTAGLDPIASGLFKDKLRAARARGASVLLASHTLSELEELADDVVFLLDGRIRFHGPMADLMRVTGFARLEKAIATLMQRGQA